MRLTDWRDNEYGVGDTIFYPRMSGRSVEICEATVVDIWTAYRDPESFKWKRLEEGQELPTKMVGRSPEWELRPVDSETRVKVQPNGRGSRDFWRTDYTYRENAEGVRERVETGIKPVVLNIIANVTKVTG